MTKCMFLVILVLVNGLQVRSASVFDLEHCIQEVEKDVRGEGVKRLDEVEAEKMKGTVGFWQRLCVTTAHKRGLQQLNQALEEGKLELRRDAHDLERLEKELVLKQVRKRLSAGVQTATRSASDKMRSC